MNAVQEYLRLSSPYCQYLGGLRWSSIDDTLVYPDSRTFAFNEEVAAFLSGFGRQQELIHFGHMLHLLDLLRNRRGLRIPEAIWLDQAFGAAGAFYPNAGAFFGALCRDMPRLPLNVKVEDVCERLRHPGMPIRWFIVSFHDTFHPSLGAPLEPEEFEKAVLRAVAAYTDDELRHWFRFGQGVVKEAGEEIARQLPVPRTLTGILALLLDRPRLAGAQAFVTQLVSALTLPPRRLALQELPVGGYADVTTHGPPEDILPSQFALDDWDFFRRFADHELLFYRREEPQTRSRQDMVVLLDQGVRTWGEVRLVLSAAALAFGRQAGRRKMPFFLAATSRPGVLLDPLLANLEELGRLVEASDLSPNPGLALESVLEKPAAGARDVVLLTHPHNLREPDVRAAARRLARGVRLFAVAMEGGGKVELLEMRHGAPVPVRRFKVSRPAPASEPAISRPVISTEHPAEPSTPWRGDVEPIAFPFRFGVGSPLLNFEFDYAGEWLLTATRDGMQHVYRLSEGFWEILPRPLWQDRTIALLDMVLGVRGGFLVIGRHGTQPLAAHYDLLHRTCKVYALGHPRIPTRDWHYSAEHHAAFLRSSWGNYGLDLATGQIKSLTDSDVALVPPPERRLRCVDSFDGPVTIPNCGLNPEGEISLVGVPSWSSGKLSDFAPDLANVPFSLAKLSFARFTPLADGLPVLRGWTAEAAQYRPSLLALLTTRPGPPAETILRLFRGPQGIPLATYPMRASRAAFALSEDGEQLARLVGEYWVEVNRVGGDNGLLLATRAGGFSRSLRLVLGDGWLFLATTKNHRRLIRWDRAELEITSWHNRSDRVNQDGYYLRPSPAPGRREAVPEGVPAWLDRERFVKGVFDRVFAVVDKYGQVAILDVDQRLVCMFFAFRERIAAWMPDGTCHGPVALTGAAPTADALARIGQALRQAAERGRKVR
jgi:hypothetical protein